jgi:drug/metabolite transporter (DMT)-like permease
MLVAVEPVLILSVGVIAFKEKLTPESIIAIIFCVLGIAVISILPHLTDLKGTSPSRGLGDFAAVAAILTYALYYGLNRSFKKEEATLSTLIPSPLKRGFTLASIIYFFAAIITGLLMLFLSPYEPRPELAPSSGTFFGLLALGFIPTILGHTLSQIVSRRAHPIWVSLMSPGETLMSLVIGVLFLNQALSSFELWGGFLIAIGVGIAIYGESH